MTLHCLWQSHLLPVLSRDLLCNPAWLEREVKTSCEMRNLKLTKTLRRLLNMEEKGTYIFTKVIIIFMMQMTVSFTYEDSVQ